MTSYDDVEVMCPFFRMSEKRRIVCEGISDDCVNSMEFVSSRLRDRHKERYCDKKYQNCRLYRMLQEKYES